MPNLTFTQFEQYGIRSIMVDEAPWFVAKDVANALAYVHPSEAIAAHCKHAKSLKDMPAVIHRWQQDSVLRDLPINTKFIPEGDIYRLIARSQLPSAAHFQDWVCDEMLPRVHKTGKYMGQPASTCIHDPVLAALISSLIDLDRHRTRQA